MGLKKRSKVSAEFSMSSLTDLIFLLLIFFMLTSNMVNFDKYDLPESDAQTVAPVSIVVALENGGALTLNAKPIKKRKLLSAIRQLSKLAGASENSTVTIVAEKSVPYYKVSEIVAIASKLKVKAIIATKPTE